ncbi:MAG: BlaI/MecI/CopY family transcriptional regulator [Vicinamibacteria bacterium]|nr:BlaI/MecI/CopY family transcriptional regulator [Vicinamibacteria bacterium]
MRHLLTLPRLSHAELDILKVLWREGGLSAREIHDRIRGRTGWAYSTTRTLIERLVRKGVITKSVFHGLHLYAPGISRAQGLARFVKDFSEQVLDLSKPPLRSLFMESDALSAAEILELGQLLAGAKKMRES